MRCDGAVSAAITSLTLTPLGGTATAAPLTASASCTDCSGAITASGSAPATPGVYQLRMNFTAEDAAGRVFRPFRQSRYVYAGPAGLVQLCGHGWTISCPNQLTV